MAPHYLVLNRYDDEDADYARHHTGHDCRLSYVTLPRCAPVLAGLGVAADRVETVPALDPDTALAAARRLAARHGAFDGVVGLSELDVLTAAQVRDALGAPGLPAGLVRGFRDKVVMKERLTAAGVPVPRFTALTPDTTAEDVVAAVGLPAVLKPRWGAASAGVRVVADKDALRAALEGLGAAGAATYECEEFVSTEIYHVDGVLVAGRQHFLSVSGYVNTPLDYAGGRPLGSVILDPGRLRSLLAAFALRCVRALGLETGCFHLEVVRRPTGEPVFMEVGMRSGGAEVPHVHRELHGIDLVTETFRTALGIPLESADRTPVDTPAGWVVWPEPRERPGRVLRCTSVIASVPQVYAEVLPEAGEVFDGNGGYCHVPGRFRLSGPDERSLRAAVRRVMDGYVVEYARKEGP
ncbi:hypothetical protein GCM10010218_32570 [Streptomyces mashuensis]|uniref:ATP-grasp domain-containing protein n=1 Tax=Streptomyces mashuensis TaxID=33904 RepID=A0A919B597_9ACTN|nr:ATP-grasp domain-containing protein [Streptomyces mashuensis]GHF48573.1 hypothetical protein GCM10010218_32570 [Streptomyces mashuensis]